MRSFAHGKSAVHRGFFASSGHVLRVRTLSTRSGAGRSSLQKSRPVVSSPWPSKPRVFFRGPKMSPSVQIQTRTAFSNCSCGSAASRGRPRGPTTAYIALGSNLGDRVSWIEKACREMDKRGIRVKRTSSLWETEPMYVLDQDRFVNGACEVRSSFFFSISPTFRLSLPPCTLTRQVHMLNWSRRS